MQRREAIKAVGFSSFLVDQIWNKVNIQLGESKNPLHKILDNPVTAIVIGAGARGNTYGGYALKNPGEIAIVGVAEPVSLRNERFAEKHQILSQNRFVSWENV
jgi:hypothetical protein